MALRASVAARITDEVLIAADKVGQRKYARLKVVEDAWKKRALNDPELFFLDVLRIGEWTDTYGRPRRLRHWQEGFLREIKARLDRGERHIKGTVCSCHGAGKGWLLAGLTLWIMSTRRDSRVLTTAQSWRGIENLLWPEIHRLYYGSLLRGWGTMLGTKFTADEKTWYAIGAASDHPENLEGHHSQTCAGRIIDEAKAVEDAIFDVTEGMLDAPETFDFWISTPAGLTGRFYERDTAVDASVIHAKITTDDLIADGIPGRAEWKASRLADWGPADPLYQSRVMANYIDVAEGALYPYSHIERALAQTWEPEGRPIGGVDVAGSVAGDENVVAFAWGPDAQGRVTAKVEDSWREQNTMVSKGRALLMARKANSLKMRVDVIGIGKGLCDALAADYPVESYRASDPATEPDRFANRKAEDAWALREMLEAGTIRLIGEKLKAQMVAMKWVPDARGRVRVVDPSDSPDHFDALLIATAGLHVMKAQQKFRFIAVDSPSIFSSNEANLGRGWGDSQHDGAGF